MALPGIEESSYLASEDDLLLEPKIVLPLSPKRPLPQSGRRQPFPQDPPNFVATTSGDSDGLATLQKITL